MKTSFGRPTAEQMGAVRVPWLQDKPPPAPAAESRTLAGSVVLTVQRDTNRRDDGRSESARSPSGQRATIASLGAEERLLLGLIDGRLSVARLARISGLSEDAAARHLQALCAKGLAARAPTNEVTIEGRGGEPFFKLGAYEVAGRVGQGGMGSVYVCRRTSAAGFRKLFALKVVRQGSGQETFALRTLVRELKVGQMLSHPNVQSVVDVGTYKDQPFLVLDYVEGTDLEELVGSCGGPLPPALVVTVMLDMLRGLQRAHDTVNDQGGWLGLVHADVSPPNVLIGIDGVARLADFGSARFTAAGEADHDEPFKLGKPAYMAPEQFLGEPLDARTDLFAAGITMWTALTGRDLFSSESYDEIVHNVQHKEIERPSLHGAPACLDRVCLRALSRRRDGRYASADDMAADLLRVAAAEGLLATSKQVGEYIERQLGEELLERRKQIDERLRGYRTAATPPVTVTAAPGVDSIPAVVRKTTTAPTVVMLDRQPVASVAPAATKRRRDKRAATRFEIYLTVALGAIAFSLVVLVFTRSPRPRAVSARAATASPAARAATTPVKAAATANGSLPPPADSGAHR